MGATAVDFSHAEKVRLMGATAVASSFAKEAIAGMKVPCDH